MAQSNIFLYYFNIKYDFQYFFTFFIHQIRLFKYTFVFTDKFHNHCMIIINESIHHFLMNYNQPINQDSQKQSNTTPEKIRAFQRPQAPLRIANKISNLSNNVVSEYSQNSQNKREAKLNVLAPPKHLKISQRVITNPKQSHLTYSQIDYAASANDQKEPPHQYLDEFENLLYEEEAANTEKQLTLNDSFQEFEKKSRSDKNISILKEVNQRKEKQTQEKIIIDSLKTKIKSLIDQEKEWICKNMKIKVEIKKIKNAERNCNEPNRQLEELKLKVIELKNIEKKLVDQLNEVRKKNSLQILVSSNDQKNNKSKSSSRTDKQDFFQSMKLVSPELSNAKSLTNSLKGQSLINRKIQNRPSNLLLSSIKSSDFNIAVVNNINNYSPTLAYPTQNLNINQYGYTGKIQQPPPNIYLTSPNQVVNQTLNYSFGPSNKKPSAPINNDYVGYPGQNVQTQHINYNNIINSPTQNNYYLHDFNNGVQSPLSANKKPSPYYQNYRN